LPHLDHFNHLTANAEEINWKELERWTMEVSAEVLFNDFRFIS
jgi:hypothetical protein